MPIETSRSGNQLMLTDTNTWDFDKDVVVSVEYKLYGVRQSFALFYKTMLPFTASSYQETRTEYKNNTGVTVMTNRISLNFTQPVS